MGHFSQVPLSLPFFDKGTITVAGQAQDERQEDAKLPRKLLLPKPFHNNFYFHRPPVDWLAACLLACLPDCLLLLPARGADGSNRTKEGSLGI